MTQERVQKILARAGYGSRRACELIITAGRVKVNKQIIGLGDKADADVDEISVDGRQVKFPESFTYVALNKPRNVISAVSTPEQRKTVRDLVGIDVNLFPVGRLDVDSEGLILLTNDGELANQLTHPRYEHEKEYRVLVARHPDAEQLNLWKRGVVLEDGYKTKPAGVWFVSASGKGAWLRVILHEGRKRQIREMGNLTGLPLVRIIRMRIASLELGTLKPGEWRYLTPIEITGLKGKTKPVKKKSQGKLQEEKIKK
jgi:23S rRNA pseudouridine2605 synthase